MTLSRFWFVFVLAWWMGAVDGAQASDWPQYRGPHADGVSEEQFPAIRWSTQDARQLWKVPTPRGFSSFSVAGGRVFTLISPGDDLSERKEFCLALDATTGDEIWRAELGDSDYGSDGGNSGAEGNRGGDGPRSTPATDGERCFVFDSHMRLTCFDAKNGSVVWQQDILQDYAGRSISWLNAVSPVLDEQFVYVIGGGVGQSFLAFDKVTGELAWKSGDETSTHATGRLATIGGVRQFVYFAKSGLVGVNAGNGNVLWHVDFPFSTSTAASPIVADNLVYASAGYGVGAGLFRVHPTGESHDVEEIWFKPNQLMNHWSSPVLRDGHLYGIYEFKKYGDAPLQCVELATGEIKWSQRGFGPGNCILVGTKLVVLSDDGRLVIVDANPDHYEEIGQASVVNGKCWSTPAYSNGRIYVRSTEEGTCVDVSEL